MKTRRLITARADDLVEKVDELNKDNADVKTWLVSLLSDMAFSLALIVDLMLEKEWRERGADRSTDAGSCRESVNKDSESGYTF